ncbi:MAG: ATP-binding cassette domain-containing protein [Candidatus Hydrogenedentes bacterium]|nr:ATP-binding cassette domain-containing protein [Candidatus Hydrogenedentota bacterium]
MGEVLLRLAEIDKSFGGAPALRGARLEVRAGEVHGLVGENGAGKSTLINIATGVLRADLGAIEIDGKAVTIENPRHARALGIAVVHQEADLFPQLSVAENMLLAQGLVRGPGGFIDWTKTNLAAEAKIARMGESYDVRQRASALSVAQRMMTEIAAAVSQHARVLFLDEPTASLTAKEIHRLFSIIRELRGAGVGIVYVSHRLDEVLTLCDRVTVMRDGETITTQPAAELSMDSIVAAMIGRESIALYARERSTKPADTNRGLDVSGLTDAHGAFGDVSLSVRAGEIVGLYGFVGAGRSELGQTLFGMRKAEAGTISLDGNNVHIASPRDALRKGIAYLPEDRLVQGLFRGHSLRANASAGILRRLSRMTWINQSAERAMAGGIVRDMRVRAQSIELPIGTLSGGNQQKVVFGRWQAASPRVLILDEPTRGVDVGAKAEIHSLINDLANRGAAVLLISSELPEIMAMSDRVVTLSAGKVTGEFDPKVDGEHAIASAAVPRSAAPESKAGVSLNKFSRFLNVRESGLIVTTLALCAAMAVLRPSEFANAGNLLDVLSNAALPAMMAQGAMMIICAGGIDISVGAMMGLVAAVAGMAAVNGASPGLCVLLACALGCASSMINAGIALMARIHPIIITLAGISIYRGIMILSTGGREVVNLPQGYRALADGHLFGVPKLCYYVLVLTVITHAVLRYRLAGRRALALGNSESAARQAGLSKARLTMFVFAYSGVIVGLVAVLHAAYYGKVQSNTGDGMELKAIAAAVIGGTNILGGRGSAVGTLLGAFLVALLYNALTLLAISSYWQNAFIGALILGAVIVDAVMQRGRREA